jgi:hypothetical protein
VTRFRRTPLLLGAAACAIWLLPASDGATALPVSTEVRTPVGQDPRTVSVGVSPLQQVESTSPSAAVGSGTAAPLTSRRAAPVAIRLGQGDEPAPIVRVGVDADGAMEIPKDVATVGWYEPTEGAGIVPGEPGTAVLAGHVASLRQGRGAFSRLESLAPEDEVEIHGEDGSVQRWRVVEVRRYEKSEIPLGELFVWDGPARLALVTCGGPFDWIGGRYRDNVVVLATPA